MKKRVQQMIDEIPHRVYDSEKDDIVFEKVGYRVWLSRWTTPSCGVAYQSFPSCMGL